MCARTSACKSGFRNSQENPADQKKTQPQSWVITLSSCAKGRKAQGLVAQVEFNTRNECQTMEKL